MVTIEENHELLDIILGYKPDRFLPEYLEVSFVNITGVDVNFKLTSPKGIKYFDITTYRLSDVGVWTWEASSEHYYTKKGTILVIKSEFGKFMTVEIDLEREDGDVLVKGNGRLITVSGGTTSTNIIPYSDIRHYKFTGNTYTDGGVKHISVGKYQYFNDFDSYYLNYYAYNDYKTLSYFYRTYTADEQTLDDVFLIPTSMVGTGLQTLKIRDITTGSNVTGNIYIKIFSGWGYQDDINADIDFENEDYVFNSPVGPVDIEEECGYYTVMIWGDYYKETFVNVYILPEPYTSPQKDVYLTPTMKADGLKAVLTWGDNPSDLDSHILGYLDGGQQFHVYYSNKDYYGNDGRVHVNLDVDDTSSYGPETISIYYRDNGFKYYYYIYCYSSHTYGIPADARVAVYSEGRLLFTVAPPTEHTGDSNYLYWKVFSYDGTTQDIRIKNKVVTYTPDEYNWEEE